jgi:hypothetical protein
MFTVFTIGLSAKCARNFHIVVATYLTLAIQLPFITLGINMAVSQSTLRCNVAHMNPVKVIRNVLLLDVPASVQ